MLDYCNVFKIIFSNSWDSHFIEDFNSRNKIWDRHAQITAKWASYLKTSLPVKAFTSQQTLTSLTNNLQW